MKYRSQPLAQHDHYSINRLIVVGLTLLALLVLTIQLAHLSILKHARYSEASVDNLHTDIRLAPPRGNILDREGRILATNQRTYSLTFSPYGLTNDRAREVLKSVQQIIGTPTDEKIEDILATRPRGTRHRLLRHANQADIIAIIERPSDFPGVRKVEDFRREYEYPAEFALVIGHLGKIPAEEKEKYPRSRYLPDDDVGRVGLEKSMEEILGGVPGIERIRRDARGNRLADPDLKEATVPGRSVTLSIDAELQRRAYELLAYETGSIVVMDVTNGDLLIVASTPTFDPRRPGAQEWQGRPAGFVNRALRGQYPPASTFKIVGAAAALRAGILPTDKIQCEGHVTIGGRERPFWCNVRTGHGPMNMAQSLKYSCNSYYYELGKKLGVDPFVEMTQTFEFGKPTGIQWMVERSGSIPEKSLINPLELTNFSIGQGRLLATPVQVARTYMALANGGYLRVPRVVTHIDGQPIAPVAVPRMSIPEDHIAAINKGLDLVVNQQGGTVYKVGIPAEWQVVGKSGTAENSSGGVDAWFAGFFPRSKPRYAFVVQIEGADGHGGEVSGPIARDMISSIIGKDDLKVVAKAP